MNSPRLSFFTNKRSRLNNREGRGGPTPTTHDGICPAPWLGVFLFVLSCVKAKHDRDT